MKFTFVVEPLDENDAFIIDILIEECKQEYERRRLKNESGETESEENGSKENGSEESFKTQNCSFVAKIWHILCRMWSYWLGNCHNVIVESEV